MDINNIGICMCGNFQCKFLEEGVYVTNSDMYIGDGDVKSERGEERQREDIFIQQAD